MRRQRFSTLSEINVTNLVDVTMVLLIIFMITAPLLRSGMEVDLPESSARDITPREGIVVSLSRDGVIYIDEQPVNSNDFSARLLQTYSAKNNQRVLIQADKAVAYGKVIALMDDIKSVGIHNVGLIVNPSENK